MKVQILDNHIELMDESTLVWTLDIDSIRLIGEYTTGDGPLLDDYFFVFGSSLDTLFQATNDSLEDPDFFWTSLSKHLGVTMVPRLSASTIWQTNIMYPEGLQGLPLFEAVPAENRNRTFLEKLFRTSKLPSKIELTDAARSLFLKGL